MTAKSACEAGDPRGRVRAMAAKTSALKMPYAAECKSLSTSSGRRAARCVRCAMARPRATSARCACCENGGVELELMAKSVAQ